MARNSKKASILGHYEIIRELGSGGMGEVYLAKDQKLDRQVAVKILNEKFSNDESNLSRFIREAKAASALNHPNILVIHEIGEADGAHFIVSEYVEGETLREICREKPLQLSEGSGHRHPNRRGTLPPPTKPISSTATSSRKT